MHCRLWSILLCGTTLVSLSGCMGYTPERRVVSTFMDSWKKADLEGLEKVTSTDFQSTALRRKDASDAFKVLNFPTGAVEILSVKDEGPDEKRVLASIGDKKDKNKKRKIYCDLIRDPETKRWVVDDLELKRQLKPGQVNKTVTEQMDLLLSIQEFVDAWESGQRSQILAASTPELRKTLEVLPEAGLKKFSARVVKDLDRKRLKPEVDGHANTAVVRLPTRTGEIMVTMNQVDSRWVADDLAVQSRKEGVSLSSLRKQAEVMYTAMQFCDAYRSGNKAELEKLCVPRFYRLNLESADLKVVPLPAIDLVQGDIEVKLLMTQADVLLKYNDEIIQLMLTQGRPEIDEKGRPIETDVNSQKPFLVEEVTLHELKTRQDMRLSSLFTSQTLVQQFARALSQRDLKAIRVASSADFKTRVWNQIELENMGTLPLDSVEAGRPQIVDTRFHGSLTEVTVNQGATPLTYVLRDEAGKLMVDDVLTPALDRPNSLKQTLEVVAPLNAFREAMRDKDMKVVRANSSREFNRMVFSSMSKIPRLKADPTPYLDNQISRIQLTADRAVLNVGDDRYGAKVYMNREGDKYVIDDIVMVGGLEQAQRVGLKQTLRELVVGGTQIGSTRPKILPAVLNVQDQTGEPIEDEETDVKKPVLQHADFAE